MNAITYGISLLSLTFRFVSISVLMQTYRRYNWTTVLSRTVYKPYKHWGILVEADNVICSANSSQLWSADQIRGTCEEQNMALICLHFRVSEKLFLYQEKLDGRGMWHVWATGEVHNRVFYSETWEGKRLRGRPRRRWEDNVKMDLNL